MIIMVSSSVINYESFSPYQTDLDDIMMEKGYKKGSFMAYKNSKVLKWLKFIPLSDSPAAT